jgi:hypothetical protein
MKSLQMDDGIGNAHQDMGGGSLITNTLIQAKVGGGGYLL